MAMLTQGKHLETRKTSDDLEEFVKGEVTVSC